MKQLCGQIVIGLFLSASSLMAESIPFSDDFENGSILDGDPVFWHHDGPIESEVQGGDLILTGTGHNGVVLGIPGDDFLYRDVVLQTQFRFLESSTADDAVVLFSRASEDGSSYWGAVRPDGLILSGVATGDVDTIHGETASGIDVFNNDLRVELATLGDNVSFTVWEVGEAKPLVPQISFTDPGLSLGVIGLSVDSPSHASAVFRDFKASGASAVPEPTGAILAGIVILLGIMCRRR